MKDFAKSIKTMNSNKEEIIKKKKQEGATLKVDNGQKLEFSDGSTFVKTSFSEDYREAKNYTGNKNVGNRVGKLFTEEERARIALGRYEEAIKRGYEGGVDYEKKLAKEEIKSLEKIARGEAKYIGFEEKDIPDAKRAIEIYKKIVRNKKTGNSKIGNIDPRIAAFKSKLQNLANQGDVGAIKDVQRFVEDMIKDISKQKDEAYKTLKVLEENRQGYIDLRIDIVNALLDAKKNQ